VQEIAVLHHPVVHNHLYIVQLIGICWGILDRYQVWPVLVFKKTQFGDLHHFMKFGNGRNLSFEDKFKACREIRIALRDMHRNAKVTIRLISKIRSSGSQALSRETSSRKNVLIFENGNGTYHAQMARVFDRKNTVTIPHYLICIT
jgi:hypothetical protein